MRTFSWLESEELPSGNLHMPGHQTKGCNHKKRYPTKYEAEIKLIAYRIDVIFSTMCSYWCKTHNAYHLGHSNSMPDEEVRFRDSMINIHWGTKKIKEKVAS